MLIIRVSALNFILTIIFLEDIFESRGDLLMLVRYRVHLRCRYEMDDVTA